MSTQALSHVLDEDPELGDALDPRRRAVARTRALAPVLSLDPGSVDLRDAYASGSGWLGLLVLEGVILHRTTVLGRSNTQVLGQGDVLCPCEIESDFALLPSEASFRVLVPSRIALLDDAFAERVGPWPSIASALVARVERRAQGQAVARALGSYPRVDVRLVTLMWELAQRFGVVVTDETVLLPLPLTHTVLATLVGCERQSVSAALRALKRDGLVARERGGWVLHGTLPLQVASLLSRPGADPGARRPFAVLPGGVRNGAAGGFPTRSTG